MLKFYWLYYNDGDWGGFHSKVVIAESEEEAETKWDWYVEAINTGTQHGVLELDNDRVLREILGEVNEEYEFTYELKKKEEPS